MTGSDGEHEVVTLQERMTSAPDPARCRIPPKKEGAAWVGAWAPGGSWGHVTAPAEAGPWLLVSLWPQLRPR